MCAPGIYANFRRFDQVIITWTPNRKLCLPCSPPINAGSCPLHSSSRLTPLGSCATRRDGDGGRGELRMTSRDLSTGVMAADEGRFALTVTASGSATSTTGTNSAEPRGAFPESMNVDRLRSSMIHLRNWLAFTPALSARPATDAPGFSHASISRRLPSGSKQCRPPSSMCVTLRGRKSSSSEVMLRPQVE